MTIPSCTYRIQLNDHFTFKDLKGIVDYLHQLGVDTIYASPITTAFKGSTHGYDVTDPLRLNPEIGTEEELEQLAADLKTRGMQWLQDIVPNHMAYHPSNPWLYDVLERGRDSAYYKFFDIIDHPIELLGDKLMAPFLGATLTECLQKNELSLQYAAQGFVIRYYETDYPVTPDLYSWICTVAEGYPDGLIEAVEELVKASKSDPTEWQAVKSSRIGKINDQPAFRSFIENRVAFINQRHALLETLLQGQHYQLTVHSLSSTHINYRRFFTVNSLICLRMESDAVFEAWHQRIHYWYTRGWIQGLRIDHIDGLAAPKSYCHSLQNRFGKDCYIIAEKILTGDETLPDDWNIQGTSGYDFLAQAGQLLTDPEGSRHLLDYYQTAVIALPEYPEVVFERKSTFLRTSMGGELDNLFRIMTHDEIPLTGQNAERLKDSLANLMASFPVYRTYPAEPTGTFLSRLMQFTGPLAAKGVEDTTFYVYNPYIALNEVGDSPAKAGLSAEAFHQKMGYRKEHYPHTMNGTSTHDTKRGEDSRIRISLLSADPQAWIAAVTRWRELNQSLVIDVKGRPSPSPNDEYLIYQALLGGFPEDGAVTDEFRDRFAGYLTKALREAKAETNYDHPDEEYEKQCQAFAAALLQADSAFLGDFKPFAADIITKASIYSLSLLLIKLTAPGIPDIYQGAELWETSFVDPDNRRPVDYTLRKDLLQHLVAEEAKGLEAAARFATINREKGAEKLFTIYRTLHYRNEHRLLFAEGEYIPIRVEGPLLAYIRRNHDDWALILVPLIRSNAPLPDSINLILPADAPFRWKHLFTGEELSCDSAGTLFLENIWNKYPVALLVGPA